MKYLALIPARYASTRFPGKPLADIGGKPMIRRVYEQVNKAVGDVYVATDDARIFDAVVSFGGKAVMTSSNHRSGTDRCCEAMDAIGGSFDVVLNIQGDEPFVQPQQIEALMECFNSSDVEIATLVKPFSKEDGLTALMDAGTPKVVLNKKMQAIYFSRSVVPYVRDAQREDWLSKHVFYKHIGLYGYRCDVLHDISRLEPTPLEKAESLEQLRWIENGYVIKVGITDVVSFGIDFPDDIPEALAYMKKHNL